MYSIDDIDSFIMQSMRKNDDSEIVKARQIAEQLRSSIDWLNFEINKQTDYQQKTQLQKERTAAEWELERINKEINKVKV